MPRKLSAKAVDKLIEDSFRKNCSGVAINILDIGKIFTAGRKALADGADLDAAVIAATNAVRVS